MENGTNFTVHLVLRVLASAAIGVSDTLNSKKDWSVEATNLE